MTLTLALLLAGQAAGAAAPADQTAGLPAEAAKQAEGRLGQAGRAAVTSS